MGFSFRALTPFLASLLFTPDLFASAIIVGTRGFQGPDRIDTLTGSATPVADGVQNWAATQGRGPELIFTTSPINLYEWSISKGICQPSPCLGSVWNVFHNLGIAYDSDHGILYESDGTGLYRVGLPPNSYFSTETFIGPLTTFVIDYVPGAGLYGIDGAVLVRIDPSTGNTTPVTTITLAGGPLFGLRDFAYDDATGKLIASWFDPNLSVFDLFRGPGPFLPAGGRLYEIDRATGVATLLTDRGPSIYGLARVEEVPEPGTFMLVGGVLLAAGGLLRRTLR